MTVEESMETAREAKHQLAVFIQASGWMTIGKSQKTGTWSHTQSVWIGVTRAVTTAAKLDHDLPSNSNYSCTFK